MDEAGTQLSWGLEAIERECLRHAIYCRKSEMELSLLYEQSGVFTLQDLWFASPSCERRG
jgi:hypothetical protein